MKTPIRIVLLAVLAGALLATGERLVAQSALGVKIGRCLGSVYVRTSVDYQVLGHEDYLEVDTDAGLPIDVTMPAIPAQFERLEVWSSPQGSQTITIDPNGQATAGASLSFSGPISGRLLLWIDADGPGPNGGYWRVTPL